MGIPKGKKSHITEVPSFIKEGKKSHKRAFLRGCFDGDGSVSFSPKQGLRIINFGTSSARMIEGVHSILNDLNIRNSISKNKMGMYYIIIPDRKNLERFRDDIGFNHSKRYKKLEVVLDSYFKKPL